MKYRIAVLTLLLFVPMFVFGQDTGGLVPCSGPDCEACHVVELVDNILDFLFEIGVIIGTILIVVGGFYLLTSGGDTGKRSKGKSIITNVIIGLIIMLTSWLIVDTVMKTFVSDDVENALGPWNEIQCLKSGGTASLDTKSETKENNQGVTAGSQDQGSGEDVTGSTPRVGEKMTTTELWECMQKTLSPDVGTFQSFMNDQFADGVPSKGIWFKDVTNATEILNVAKSCGADEFHVDTNSVEGPRVYVGIRD